MNAAPRIVSIRLWNEAEFAAADAPWSQLLARTRADPLFMSWLWQWQWWTAYAQELSASLHLVALYSADGRLVGIAPLYRHRARTRGWIRTWRLELIGSAWRNAQAMYSEFLDVIADPDWSDEVVDALVQHLRRTGGWQELVFANVRDDSLARRIARRLQDFSLVRTEDCLDAHVIPIRGDFTEYLERLSSGTRRKLFHQRAKLPQASVQYSTDATLQAGVDQLIDMRDQRWGCRASAADRRFLQRLAAAMWKRGCLRLSRLAVETQSLSALCNIRAGDTEYYLMSGFTPLDGISPGYLHMGYAIEAAHRDGLRAFALLAGPGRHRDYKADYAADTVRLCSLHCLKSGWLKLLYRLHALRGVPCAS